MTSDLDQVIIGQDTFTVGSDVVCIRDHQMHDKINYLGQYTVHSISTFEDEGVIEYSGVCLEITSKVDHNRYWIPVERFRPVRMEDRALADPQPVIKRTDAPTRTQADKADAGKISTLIFDQDFLEANLVTAQIFEYGAQKYSRESFYRVAFDDWEKAEGRHKRSRIRKDMFDAESGLLHLAHEAANKIVMLQLEVKRLLAEGYTMEQLTKFNPPPQDHKNG